MRGSCIYLNVMVQMYLKGWDFHTLSEKADISYASLRRKMRGDSPLHLEEARRIQAALACRQSLDDLFALREA